MGPLLLLYLLSGAGAVAIETVWMRWLRLLLGATAPAASATLVAFFAGHALGAAWAARRADHWRRPLGVYGRLEITGALCAAMVPLLLAGGEQALAALYDGVRAAPGALAALRLALALGATLPAAFCFGATFPAIGQAAAPVVERLGARGTALYAVNTLGAALGTIGAVFFLPDAIGVRGTYGLAAALLASAGVAALVLERGRSTAIGEEIAAPARPAASASPARAGRRRERRRPRAPAAPPGLGLRALVGLAALSGFCAFALQVLWVQAFSQVLDQSVYAFGAVLVAVLLAIAAAGAAVAWCARRGQPDPRTLLGAALAVAALAVAAFPSWLFRATDGLGYVGASAPGLRYVLAALASVGSTAGPALLAGSLVFPLTLVLAARAAGPPREPALPAGHQRAELAGHQRAELADGLPAGDRQPGPGAIVGRLTAANTAGALLGALAAPYLLLPTLGPWTAFLAVALVWGAAAAWLPDATPRRRLRRDALLAVGWVAILTRASPLALPPAASAAGERVLAVESSPAGVVSAFECGGERLIRIDGHYALGGTADRIHLERQGHLPLLLAPGARRVAHVGSATGISAGAALAHPIESLTLVELVPAVARIGAAYFADANHGVYGDPRSHVVLDDARNFLRLTRERFDVVVADLFVPWHAGSGALYTREHFAAVRAHLSANGVFCQWLPLYQLSAEEMRILAATFLDVFPRAAVFRGDFYGRFPIAALVGFAGEPPTPEAVSAAAAALGRAGVSDRWVTDPLGPWALYVGPLAALAPALADAPRNSDDRPRIEQLAAAGHAGGERGKVDPFVGAAWIRFTETLRAAAQADGDPVFPALPEAAARAAEGGASMQRAGALYLAGRGDDAARAFTRAAALLPPRLVADAPADPTAANLWRADPP